MSNARASLKALLFLGAQRTSVELRKRGRKQAFLQGMADQLGNVGAMLTAILGAVFFTLLLITTNTMAQAIRERTSELAVLKTLGFTNGRVLGLVLLEAGVLAILGGAAGLGLVSLSLSGGDPTGGFLPAFSIPPRDLVIGAGLVVALGVISTTWPGLRATRLQIVDGLGR